MAKRYRNFIYNADNGFIFAYVPKVACTNWKCILRYMAGYEDYLDNRLAHDKENGGLVYLDAEDIDREVLSPSDTPIYAMVRSPYSRVLSAYLNKIEPRVQGAVPNDTEHGFIEAVREIERFRLATFEDHNVNTVNFKVFLLWLLYSDSAHVDNEHWAAQTSLLRYPDVNITKLAYFEQRARDVPVLLDAIGCDIDFPSQNQVRFPPTNADHKAADYYDGENLELVERIYANDFSVYGYPKRSLDQASISQNSAN